MGISQAGLSKSISSLESVLGAKLFVRSREGLTLTREGAEVRLSAAKILEEAASLENRIKSLQAAKAPAKLRIGMYDSIAVYFYAELSAYMAAVYPQVILEMTVDASGVLAKEIESGSLDLVIGVHLERFKKKQFEYYKLFDDYYGFYVSSKITSTLSELPILIHSRADDIHGSTIETLLQSALKQRTVHRVYNFETLKTLTSQGVGIGVLPTQVAKPLMKTGALVSTELPKVRHLIGSHSIGFLVTSKLASSYGDFADDIYRLGERWSNS